MSHLRRVGGRFVTHDAHSTYTRALVAPSSTWKKQWVTPAGVPVGSNYKVLKWVLSDEPQEFSDEDSDDEEIEGFEDNSAPTLVLPAQPAKVAPSPSSNIKPEPSPQPEIAVATAIASTSTLVVQEEEVVVPPPAAEEAAPAPPQAQEPVVASTSTAEDIVVDSPAVATVVVGEASVLPSGEMAITGEDGGDPEGEGRRIAEASLEGPPADGEGPPVVQPVVEPVVEPVAEIVEPMVEENEVPVPMVE